MTKTLRPVLSLLAFLLLFAALLFFFFLLGTRALPHGDFAPASPTGMGSRPVVVIDAGHGGEDGGAVGENGVLEKDLNLAIAQKMCELLRASGVEAVMTREEDVLLYDKNSDYEGRKKVQDLATRRQIAEQYENPVFISIHMNAFPDSRYKGLQVYYSENHPDSLALARSIQEADRLCLHPDNRRTVKAGGSNLYLLDRLSCPAILVECGFLSNAEECEELCREDAQKRMAILLSASLLNYLSEEGQFMSDGS